MASQEAISFVREQLTGLAGNERSKRVAELAQRYQKSQTTIYRWFNQAGIKLRKDRRDKGETKVDEKSVKLGASLLLTSRRLSNKVSLPACDAKGILEDSGYLNIEVSDSLYRAQLRQQQISAKDIIKPAPHKNLISDHPNHIWQFDVTNCFQYFLDEEKGLEERDLELDLSKNKIIKAAKKIKKELLRFMMVDHCTGAFYLRYFYASGERADDAERFFWEAMRPKDELIRKFWNGEAESKIGKYHFHGVPLVVMADRGSIARAKKLQNLFDALKIKLETHLPGNPRTKGSVETHMNIGNRFDALLIFKRPRNLDELNLWALDWTIKFNAVNKFRRMAPRSAFWSMITPAQLRLCPEESIFWKLISSGPITKRVGGDRIIHYDGLDYRVPDVNFTYRDVVIRGNAYELPAIDCYAGEHCFLLYPIPRDQYGRLSDGHRMSEGFKALPYTETQKAKTELEKMTEDFGITWKGTGDKRRAVAPPLGFESPLQVFGHQADKVGNVQFINRKGTELEVKQPEIPAAGIISCDATLIDRPTVKQSITITRFLYELTIAIGQISPELNQELRARYGDSIEKEEAERVIASACGGRDGDAGTGRLGDGEMRVGEMGR